MSIRKITKKQAIELAIESYYETKIHEYVFNVPAHPEMGYSRARRGEIAGEGISEVWDTSELWKPLLMKTPLVLASLAGDKTETRRLIKADINEMDGKDKWSVKLAGRKLYDFFTNDDLLLSYLQDNAPYKPGDLLYVREKWQGYCNYGVLGDSITWYREVEKGARGLFNWNFIFPDKNEGDIKAFRWLPSIHMPKRASRLRLEVTNCYPQFLQDITGDQCLAEGIMAYPEIYEEFKDTAIYDTVDELHRMVFAYIWDEIAGKDGVKWEDNPLVWVTEYKRVDYGPFVNGGK